MHGPPKKLARMLFADAAMLVQDFRRCGLTRQPGMLPLSSMHGRAMQCSRLQCQGILSRVMCTRSNVCEGACARLLARVTDNHINSLINSCQAGHTVTYPLAQKKKQQRSLLLRRCQCGRDQALLLRLHATQHTNNSIIPGQVEQHCRAD